MVVIHSSVVPMADWKEYNEIIGMGAWDGRNEKDGPYLYWKDGQYVYDYSPGYAGYHGLQHETVIEHRAPIILSCKDCLLNGNTSRTRYIPAYAVR